MALRMFSALPPYFGGKRKLCSAIFRHIARYIPREKWQGMVFVDAFLGGGAVSLFAKAQNFKVLANDISTRSFIVGKAIIENNDTLITNSDIYRLYMPNLECNHLIEKQFVPDVFSRRHGIFLDNAFANAKRPLDIYLLIKYIFTIRPYSKFSSPNAFNRPFEEGRFDEIKPTYIKHTSDNLKTPLEILKIEKNRVNAGIFSNGLENKVYKMDVFEFLRNVYGDILYLDPPYASTLSYESEYKVLDMILGDEKPKSRFSSEGGMKFLEELLS